MDKELVEVEYSYPLAKIFINRPQVLNAYNEELIDKLTEVFTEVF